MAEQPRIFGIAGWKNSGKTTLTERLIAHFADAGYRVSTVKHAHHAFDIDQPGTDSHRHRAAGASEVAIVSGHRWALMHELRDEDEPPLAEIVARLAPCDLVLVEGYKSESHAKIEARRRETAVKAPLAESDPLILAIASDHPLPDSVIPVFDLDDISAIAEFIADRTGLPAI